MKPIIAIIGIALQAALVWLLFRRTVYRFFGIFFAYNIFSVASAIAGVLLLRQHKPLIYFRFYWINETLYVIFTFFAVYEVFYRVFRNFYGIRGFRFLFPVIGILMLAAATLRAIFWPPPDSDPLYATILNLEIAVGFLQVGIFGLFFLLVRFFRLRWRQYALGIALGFGIVGAGNLAAVLLRSEIGTRFELVFATVVPVIYIIAVVVWLLTFIKAQPRHPWQDGEPALNPEEVITELRQYTRVVKGVLRR
jgi:hypothetical protein